MTDSADKPLMRAERRAMDAERRLVRVVLVAVGQAEVLADGHQRAWRPPHN